MAIAPCGSASQWPPRALRSIFLTGQARLTSMTSKEEGTRNWALGTGD